MTSSEFWAAFDLMLFTELTGFILTSYVLGYASGYKLNAFRQFARLSVS